MGFPPQRCWRAASWGGHHRNSQALSRSFHQGADGTIAQGLEFNAGQLQKDIFGRGEERQQQHGLILTMEIFEPGAELDGVAMGIVAD